MGEAMSETMKTAMKWIILGLVGAALGAGLAYFTRPEPPPVGIEGAAVGDQRPALQHAQLDGTLGSIDAFEGQAILVNFWATWCAPCRREMPLLQTTFEAMGDRLVIIGVAMDEADAVADFIDTLGITYPIWVGQIDVSQAQRRWGNPSGALPYTVLVDEAGIIRWQHLGEVSSSELDEALALIF